MIQKIKKTRGEVLTRISCIQRSSGFVPEVIPEDPPSYEEAIASASSDEEVPMTYRDLATALQDISFSPNQRMSEELIYMHDNVRLYFISPNGEVLSTQLPETLRILLVQGKFKCFLSHLFKIINQAEKSIKLIVIRGTTKYSEGYSADRHVGLSVSSWS